jgi:hypothetical protein
MAHHFSPKTITDGLDFYIDPINPKSYPGTGTSVYDISGNGYVGTLVNGPIYNSTYFTFDGVNESLRFGDILDRGTSPFTLSAWVRKTGNSISDSFGGGIVTKGSYGGNLAGYSMLISNTTNAGRGAIQLRTSNPDTPYTIPTDYSIPFNNWMYFTSMRDTVNEVARFYINTQLVGTIDVPNTANIDTIYNFTIGALHLGGTSHQRHFKGDISSIYGYNRTLTQPEIEQNYNALKGRFGL